MLVSKTEKQESQNPESRVEPGSRQLVLATRPPGISPDVFILNNGKKCSLGLMLSQHPNACIQSL